MSSSKRKNRKKLIIAFAVGLAVILLFALAAAYFILDMGEQTGVTEYDMVKELCDNRKALAGAAVDYSASVITKYESQPQVSAYLQSVIEKATITIGQEDEKYYILCDGKKAFSVKFENGLTGKKAKPDECYFGFPISVEAPEGSKVTVNGISPEGHEITDYRFLSEYETNLKNSRKSDRYVLGTFFIAPEVSATLDGESLSVPTVFDGFVYAFSYPSKYTKEVTVTIPVGAELIVNGTFVRDVSSRQIIKYPYLTRFEENLDIGLIYYSQNLGSFFEIPEIRAVYNGKYLIDEDDNFIYSLPNEKTSSYYINAPSGATVMINGIPLSDSDVAFPEIFSTLYDDIGSFSVDKPFSIEYRVEGLLFEPQITCRDRSGNELEVDTYLSTDERIVFCGGTGNKMTDDDSTFLIEFAKAYNKYTRSGLSGLGGNYNKVIKFTSSKYPAYTVLKEMYSDCYFAQTFSGIKYKDCKVKSFYSHGNDLYSAVVYIPFSATRSSLVENFEFQMQIFFTQVDAETRKVIAFAIEEAQ